VNALASGIPASGIPAHGPRRFDPGHLTTLAHGARSARFVDSVAAELADALLEDRPDLPEYPGGCCRVGAGRDANAADAEYHAKVGMIDDETGDVRGGALVFAAENMAQRMRERLGLNPQARMPTCSPRGPRRCTWWRIWRRFGPVAGAAIEAASG
jgi:hypothetical protein